MHWSTLTAVLGFVGAGEALLRGPKPIKSMKTITETLLSDASKKPSTGNATVAYFDQLIDHSRPELGTFKQRYFYSTAYYQGPGSPVSVEAPSEAAVRDEYVVLTNKTMVGFIAQNLGGAAVTLEHRFYGASTPVQGARNTENLQPLTLENSIDDLVYFARNVKFPFDPQGKSHPDSAPWTLSGCSYAGALSAWTEKLAPGTFWAYEAGSAVVQARNDLWQYYKVVGEALPQNCSADWRRVMAHIDETLMHGSDSNKKQLKGNLGAANLSDQAAAESATRWLDNWQSQQYYSGYSSIFKMCDYIENQLPEQYEPAPGPEGLGLEKALEGFFRGLKDRKLSREDTLDDGGSDPWLWQLCNEPFQWWQTERPGTPLHVTTGYDTEESMRRETCLDGFPDVGRHKVGIKLGRDEDTVNRLTGGWDNNNATRLVWVNAEFDPWLYATVSSPDRPDGPLQSTENAPVFMLRGAAHCNDYVTKNYDVNEDARTMFDGVATNMKKWAAEFYEQYNVTRRF
ncbi:serine peptidase, putative [Beauveria bassiana ARSEF 2860]|uniref:Serine peptidase, putative n=1 Tax=Beauveria bassiana (strain ARSEF 2860) TaxID=655819 RepID=J4KM52_BEAB2|nr:serine peptidase, putative [Beauveria bassiana ARSEF 2860]EJP63349.1 serine peptidase, putative [Beauveria bassiana ARSEF 2860]